MRKIKKLLAIAGVIALLAPSAAFAQSSQESYGGDNSVVAGLEHDNARGCVLETAAVGILTVHAPAREEPHVRVHAQIGADDRLHVP